MLVERQHRIYRTEIQANRDVLYIFGDNLERVGWGGQAAEMRGEVNSWGIATKRSISHSYPDDYFFDHQEDVIPILKQEFDYLRNFIQRNQILTPDMWTPTNRFTKIIVPEDGLGTGLSKMPEYAPNALRFIDEQIELLKEL